MRSPGIKRRLASTDPCPTIAAQSICLVSNRLVSFTWSASGGPARPAPWPLSPRRFDLQDHAGYRAGVGHWQTPNRIVSQHEIDGFAVVTFDSDPRRIIDGRFALCRVRHGLDDSLLGPSLRQPGDVRRAVVAKIDRSVRADQIQAFQDGLSAGKLGGFNAHHVGHLEAVVVTGGVGTRRLVDFHRHQHDDLLVAVGRLERAARNDHGSSKPHFQRSTEFESCCRGPLAQMTFHTHALLVQDRGENVEDRGPHVARRLAATEDGELRPHEDFCQTVAQHGRQDRFVLIGAESRRQLVQVNAQPLQFGRRISQLGAVNREHRQIDFQDHRVGGGRTLRGRRGSRPAPIRTIA